jgi:hypothetical protein
VAGSYVVEVSTSKETTEVNSSTYTISSANNLSFSSIVASNDTVNATSAYTIEFVLSTTGALNASLSDQIKITFPSNFTVPGTIAASSIVLENLTSGFSYTPTSVTVAGQVVTIVPSANLSNSDEVRVSFLSNAAIVNTPISGNYQLTVGTYESDGSTAVDDPVSSNPFAVVATTTMLSNPVAISLSTTTASAAVTYTLTGTVGRYGRLLAGTSTFTVTFQSNTTIPANLANISGTINSVAVTGEATDATARTVTFTVPASVSIANNGSFTLVITGAGVLNPSNGDYTATVRTSVETADVSTSSYTIGSTALAANAVTLSSSGANQNSSYTFAVSGATAMKANPDNDSFTLIFPEGTYMPTNGLMTAAHVTVNGVAVASATMSQANRTITAAIASNVTPTSFVVAAAAGLRNPPIVTSYTGSVYTSKNKTPDATNSYSVTANAVAVTSLSAAATPNVANGSAAQLQVAFTTGANGKLQGGLSAGSSTIRLDFDSGITVPASISTGNVTVNGVNPASVTINSSGSGGVLTLTIANGQTIDNSTAVTVNFLAAANLVKSASAGSYSILVRTSSETTDGTASLTLAAASSLSVAAVTVSPTSANTTASYVVKITPGTGDGLSIGDVVQITFPSNTFVPTSIPTTFIQVNGNNPTSVGSGSGQVLSITTPVALAEDVEHTIQISSAAGIINPTTAGSSYSVSVSTPTEGPASSPSYTITAKPASTITQATVALSSYATSATNVAYTITFNTGAYGRLISNSSTVSVTFPAGTTVGTPTATINGVASTVSGSGQTRSFLVPASVTIGNSSAVTLVVSGITNPATTSSTYTIDAYTSVETSPVTSSTYPVTNAAAVTINSTTFTDLTVNAPTNLTINMTVAGTGGALTSGSGTITITFPAGFTIPASNDIPTSSIQINAVNVNSVSSNQTTGVLVLTTGTNIANGATFNVVIQTTSNIRNISEPGTYTLSVKTSAQPVAANSSNQTFAASVGTQLLSLNVAVTPQVSTEPVTWNWTFTTGNRGGLKAGTGTISMFFDQSVFTLGTIPTSAVEVNGTQVAALQKSGQTITITVPSTVTIGVNETVTVTFKSGAGIKTDPNLGKIVHGARIKGINEYDAYSSPEPTPAEFNGNPLPVVLAEFKISPDKKTSRPVLKWTTFTELDNYGFYVVRKTSDEASKGEPGAELGFISGNGTSFNPIEYVFADTSVHVAGAYSYFLYQEDYNSERKHIATAEFVLKAPDDFELRNIYPNPFNPTTNIRYALRNNTKVSVQVFDMLGRQVATLVDGVQPAGEYTVAFNGTRLASGVYLIRFNAAGKTMIRKTLLVK